MSKNPIDLPGSSIRVMTLPEAPLPDARPMQALYQPLPSDAYAPSLDIALRLARQDLAEQQGADIHDHNAMVRAAVTLEVRLRGLLTALDANGNGVGAPLAAGAVCDRPGCGHGKDLHDELCFGTACECVRFVESADAMTRSFLSVASLREPEGEIGGAR